MEQKRDEGRSKYDFSNFLQIKASSRREMAEVLSVLASGELLLNAKLMKHFPENRISIRLSPNGSEIAVFLHGEEMINMGKNGRVKNYDLQKRMKEQKKTLPAYFVGQWDEEEELWYGKYLPYNPNKGENERKK